MIQAIRHALNEGRDAARHADDKLSAIQLKQDFFWSRILRLYRFKSYNHPRTVHMCGSTVHYRFNRGDIQSLREVLVEEVYQFDLPFHPCTILDLGANIGLTSLWLEQRYQPSQILAVEAEAGNAHVAAQNFVSNNLKGEVVHAAAGPADGEAWFALRNESNLGQLSNKPGPSSVRVPLLGMPSLLARFPQGKVDLVKMDIEGGEEALLSHNNAWLQKVKSLMIEWHDDRADSRPLIKLLVNTGFNHQRINASRQENLSVFVHQKCG